MLRVAYCLASLLPGFWCAITGVHLHVCAYKITNVCVLLAVMICATLVNIHADTHTDGQHFDQLI